MTNFTHVVSISRYTRNVSKLFTKSTTNKDIASYRVIYTMYTPQNIFNIITHAYRFLLIDSVNKAKEDSDKFTKVLGTFSNNLTHRFLAGYLV